MFHNPPPSLIPLDNSNSNSTQSPPDNFVNIIGNYSSDNDNANENDTSSSSIDMNMNMNISTSSTNPNPNNKFLLRIPMHQHSPDAVKLLLEYCYTNRCLSLGTPGFTHHVDLKKPIFPHQQNSLSRNKAKSPSPKTSTNTLDYIRTLHQQQVLNSNNPPATDQNLNGGFYDPVFHNKKFVPSTTFNKLDLPEFPTTTFQIAIEALQLAEEAKLPKFSLMCELSACALLNSSNVAHGLVQCSYQMMTSGNPLNHLKPACLEFLQDVDNVNAAAKDSKFLKCLSEQGIYILPAVLKGITEALPHPLARKRKRSEYGSGGSRQPTLVDSGSGSGSGGGAVIGIGAGGSNSRTGAGAGGSSGKNKRKTQTQCVQNSSDEMDHEQMERMEEIEYFKICDAMDRRAREEERRHWTKERITKDLF